MLIFKLLIFSIPAGLAAILHMVAVKLDLFPALKMPLDAQHTYRGKRIFGQNKTWRGVVLMVVFSIAGTYFLQFLTGISPTIQSNNILDFNKNSAIFYGVLFGLAYTLGELPNSFIKRQKGIEEGKRGPFIHILIDQADSPIACLIVLWAFTRMDVNFFIAGCFFYLLLHLFFNVLLFLLGIRKNPF